MNKFKNIILLSDLDGTLLDSRNKVSQKNQEAIQYFIEHGGRFGIATGRSPKNSIAFLDYVKINSPCILYNGCALYDFKTHEFLALNLLPKAQLIGYINWCLEMFPEVVVQIYLTEICCVVSSEDLADPEVIAIHQPCEFYNLEGIVEKPWVKILFSAKAEVLKAIEDKISEFGLQEIIDWVYTSEIYLEILPLHISKGSMLSPLREIVGDEVVIYAVGDYNNDQEMLRLADVGIATRNALPSLKQVADLITVSNDESAIADIIYNLM